MGMVIPARRPIEVGDHMAPQRLQPGKQIGDHSRVDFQSTPITEPAGQAGLYMTRPEALEKQNDTIRRLGRNNAHHLLRRQYILCRPAISSFDLRV